MLNIMKILYLAHRIPYPPNKGDKIRSFNEVQYLAKKYQLDLICLADNPADLKYQSNLQDICHQVAVFPMSPRLGKVKGGLNLLAGGTISVKYFYQKDVQNCVNRWIEEHNYAAVVCFSSVMAEYLFNCPDSHIQSKLNASIERPNDQKPKLIMDFCDVDSDKWSQYAADAVFPLNHIYQLENKRLLAYETRINKQFDHSILITNNEADLFRRLYPAAKRISIIRNGVDFEYFSPAAGFEKIIKSPPVLVFTGAMDYHANIDGVQWFCREIWPEIRQQFNDCQFFIVGSNPTPAVKDLATLPGVTVTGFVDDIRSYYAMANVCVVPLRLARGVQNKVLEAMSMGKAVVTTTKANAGIQAEDGKQLLIADDVDRFIKNIAYLLENSDKRVELSQRAREFVISHYAWDKNLEIMDEIIESKII